MDFSTLLENKVLLAAISGLSGVVLTLITQRILGKRGLFTYFGGLYTKVPKPEH